MAVADLFCEDCVEVVGDGLSGAESFAKFHLIYCKNKFKIISLFEQLFKEPSTEFILSKIR